MALVMDPAGSAVGAYLGNARDRALLLDPGATPPGLALTTNTEGTRTAMAVNQAMTCAASARPPVRCRAATTPQIPATPQQTGTHPMNVSARVASTPRLAAILAILGGATFASGQSAEAQVAPIPAQGVAAPGVPTPVELAINILNSQVLCQPGKLRLPARDAISLHVVNKSVRPVMFAAPEFFQASEAMQTDSVAYNQDRGGFLVGAGSTLQVSLTTPPAGEYFYACHELGEVPTVRSTGFIVVVLQPNGQALSRR